jgi:hypothetical protein
MASTERASIGSIADAFADPGRRGLVAGRFRAAFTVPSVMIMEAWSRTLDFDYEVRSAKDAFRDVPGKNIKGEMLRDRNNHD